jgi:hypothetical protein
MNNFYVEKHKKTSKPKLSEIKAEQAKLDAFITSLQSSILFPSTFGHDDIQARLQEQAYILNQTFFYFVEKFKKARMTILMKLIWPFSPNRNIEKRL